MSERDTGPGWRTRGVCRTVDPETFFPAPSEPADAAVALCRTCVVQGPCLAWALEVGDCHGVWGATTPRERRAMLVAWRAEPRSVDAVPVCREAAVPVCREAAVPVCADAAGRPVVPMPRPAPLAAVASASAGRDLPVGGMAGPVDVSGVALDLVPDTFDSDFADELDSFEGLVAPAPA